MLISKLGQLLKALKQYRYKQENQSYESTMFIKGRFLKKITEIKFGNQTITIRDVYHFSKIGCQLVTDVTKKRTHIFKKPFYSK